VDVHLIARKAENLRKAAAVAERIEVIGDQRPSPEFLLKILPPLCDLPDQRLSPRQVHIGLKIPAAARRPAAFSSQSLNFSEECGVIAFDPLVEDGFVVVKNELIRSRKIPAALRKVASASAQPSSQRHCQTGSR